MASSGGIWVPMAQRVLRQALTAGARLTNVVRRQVADASRAQLEVVPVRTAPARAFPSSPLQQPVHPAALRRQLLRRGARWLSSARRFMSAGSRTGARAGRRTVDRSAFLQSAVGTQAVWRAAGRAPFASTLRPSLTGGALPRTAGGYAAGAAGRGGARYFSHAPAAPAQVVQHVSQAMRAFWLGGQRARFDGTDARGRGRYRAVSALEEETARRLAVPALPKMAPGAFVDFALRPTITALAPLVAMGPVAAAAPTSLDVTPGCAASLHTTGFLDVLGVDFARALRELSAVMDDLKRLAGLGDLPVLLRDGSVLRVRFPGVDAATVDRLCEDLGVTRGLVGEDPGFDAAVGTAAALRFPFAPDAPAETEPARTSPGDLHDDLLDPFDAGNPWLSLPPSSASDDGYESLSPAIGRSSGAHMSSELDGAEGIYRFIEECGRNRIQVRV